MRKPRPIGSLSSLSPSQKQELRHWYESLTYDQISARMRRPAPDGFGLEVSVWQLRRYFQRLSLDDSAPLTNAPFASSSTPSISSIIDQAALGKDVFTPATVQILEQRSFELALSAEDPRKISTVFGLVLKSRDTAVRERMLEIQKQKLALRKAPENQTPPEHPLASSLNLKL